MKTILITGGAGFLGSHIAEHVLRNGHRAIVIDNLSGGVESNVPAGARFFNIDICDEFAINRLFSHIHFDAVVHCAAFASENLSHWCRLHTYRSIVIGTATLTNAAVNHGVELFINMSSIAVYGKQVAPFTEYNALAAEDPYGCAKICAETDLMIAGEMFGIRTVTFRPHNLIGVRQSLADSTRNVASIFIRQALDKKPMTIYGDGRQTRAWSPVTDVAKIIAASVDHEDAWGKTFNIGGDQVMQVYDLARKICELMGVDTDILFLPERKETKHAHSSHEEVRKCFGEPFNPQSIDDCLRKMIAEARKQPLPPVQALPRIEIHKKLTPAWKQIYQP